MPPKRSPNATSQQPEAETTADAAAGAETIPEPPEQPDTGRSSGEVVASAEPSIGELLDAYDLAVLEIFQRLSRVVPCRAPAATLKRAQQAARERVNPDGTICTGPG